MRRIAFALTGILAAFPCYATIIHVPTDYPTMQAGINASVSGDTVLVAPGTYFENITDAGIDGISLIGSEACILNGNHSIGISLTYVSGWLIDGIEMTNCQQTGLSLDHCNNITVRKCRSHHNVSENGHGFYASFCSDLVFRYNLLDHNNFCGIWITSPTNVLIQNNTITSNSMDGIIFTQAGTGCIIENNIVVDNTGHGIEFWEVPELGAIRYNDCWHNHPDYGGCTPSVGEISANPSFVDTLNINYSLHFSSPCIDAGNPDGPLDPDLTRNDMGAFPFGGFAVMPLPYRINLGGAIPNISYSLTPIIFWGYIDTASTSQQLYQIQIGTDNDWSSAEMWDSGPVSSSDTSAVYSGSSLSAHTTYFLRIRVNNGISWGTWVRFTFIICRVIYIPLDYSAIQMGIDEASDGDSIIVLPGIYYENINLLGKKVVLKSQSGPESTIITKMVDGVPIITFESGEDTSTIIDGFTLQGAGSADGIKISSTSAGTIQNNTISSNDQWGIECNSYSKILNNTIISNAYAITCNGNCIISQNIIEFNGSAIYCNSDCVIDQNIIESNLNGLSCGNSCTISENLIRLNSGYGIHLGNGDNCQIIHNRILDNTAPLILVVGSGSTIEGNIISGGNSGSAVENYNSSSNVAFSNNTVVNNNSHGLYLSSPSHWQIENNIIAYNTGGYGIYVTNPSQNTIRYNDVFGNQSGGYFGIIPGTGSISLDPQLVDRFNEDYSLTGASPCIDAGNPSSPLDPDGTRADMGALYFDQRYRILNYHLIAPQGDSVYLSAPMQYIWHSTSDIDSGYQVFYKFFIDDNPMFSSPDTSGVLLDTSYTLPDSLARSHNYYWRVLAFNYHAVPIYSNETWSFYIDGFPTLPNPFSPEGGTNADSSTVFSWYISTDPDSFDAVSYTIQVDDDSAFASPEINQSGLSSGAALDDAFAIRLGELEGYGNLQADTSYFWRVRADDNYGLSSDWTAGTNWFVFMAQNHPPNAPLSGFSPANGEEIISLTPTITWDDATDPDPDDISDSLRYIVSLFSDSSMGDLIQFVYDTTETGVNRLTVADTLPDNFLFAYVVKTLDDGGLSSDWSATQNFWTNHYNFPPEPFPLYGPSDNSKHVVYYTHFTWGNTIDYDPNSSFEFVLQYSIDSLFNNYVRTIAGISDTSLTVITDSLALLGNQVFWRVLAIDDDSLTRIGGIPEQKRLLNILPPGDANSNGITNGVDVTYLVNYLKGLGPAPDPILAGDANGNCQTNGLDVVYLVNYLKGMGAAPVRGNCDDIILSNGIGPKGEGK